MSIPVLNRASLLKSALVGFRPAMGGEGLERIGAAKVGGPPVAYPNTATVGQNQATPLTGLTLLFGSASNTIVLTDTNGLLSATGAGVTGAGTATLTITGSVAAVNTALATLTDTDAVLGADTISIVAFGNPSGSIAVTATPLDLFAASMTGDWNAGANWSLGATPGSFRPAIDDAGFAGTGSAVTISDTEAAGLVATGANAPAIAIVSGGALLIGGGFASANEGSFDLASGTLTLNAGGTLGTNVAGTPALLKLDGGTLVAKGGTLNDVTVLGTLDLSAAGAALVSAGGLSGTAPGDGVGAIKLTGVGGSLEIASTETIANDLITFGSNSNASAATASKIAIDAGATLTLAGDTVTVGQNAYAAITGAGSLALAASSTLADSGTLSIATSGGFQNDGTVTTSGYGALNISGPVTGGGTINLSAFNRLSQVAAELGSTVAATQNIAFQSGDTLMLDAVNAAASTAVGAGITGLLTNGGTIDLSHLAHSATATGTVSGKVLTIADGSTTDAVLNTADLADGTVIQLAADATGHGTLITALLPVAVTSNVASPATGNRIVGQTVTFTLATAQAVNAGLGAALTLNDGGTAAYVSGSGTTTLVFSTTIAAGQNAATLAVTGTSGTFRDSATGRESVALTGVAMSFTGLVIATTPPVAASPTLIAAENAGPTAIGIAAPTDPNYTTTQLTITAGALPTDGAVTLADGATAVTAGQALTAAQLTGLLFTPTATVSNASSTFTYTVTDPAGNASVGTATLVIPPVSLATPSEIVNDANTVITGTAQAGGIVTLLSNGAAIGSATADAATGLFAVTPGTPLGLGLNTLSATVTTAGGTSAPSATISVFDVQAPVSGVSTTDFSSADLGAVLSLGAKLNFIGGTEAVLLTDSTLSVGPDTNEATVQRLYEGLLGRASETAGMSGWDGQLTAGLGKSALGADFLNSAEYMAGHSAQSESQFVTGLYQGVLGRAPDVDGAASWNSALAQGASRADVVIGFADSAEAKLHLAPATAQIFAPDAMGTLLHGLFETGFGREIELAGLANLKAAFASLTPAQVAADIAGSQEFMNDHAGQGNAAYVTSLYQNGLGRAPDAGGAAGWTNFLDSGGGSRGDVMLDFATSQEGVTHLTRNLGA